MNILIGDLEFEGPWNVQEQICEEPGILAVLYEKDGEYELVELVESENLRLTTEALNTNGLSDKQMTLTVAAHYTADLTTQERREIVAELLQTFEYESLNSLCAVV